MLYAILGLVALSVAGLSWALLTAPTCHCRTKGCGGGCLPR